MTDKQIIERLKTDLDFERSKRKSLQAELQAKEQECEKLKEEVSLLKEINSKSQQIEDANSLEKYYLQQLDQLKAQLKIKEEECERLRFPMQDTNYAILAKEEFEEYKKLKADNDLLRKTHKTEQDRRRAYENALAEIKEMCSSVENIENVKSLYDAALSGKYLQAKEILQKISECEVNND